LLELRQLFFHERDGRLGKSCRRRDVQQLDEKIN
jgi:hypothetical protein